MPVLGLAGLGGALSTGEGTGKLGRVFFQRNEPNWTIGAAAQQQSENYVDVATEPDQIRTLGTRQVSASARVGERNWLNVLGLRTYDQTGNFDTATLGWSYLAGALGHADREPLAVLGQPAGDQYGALDHAGAAAG